MQGQAYILPVGFPPTREARCSGTAWYNSAIPEGIPTHTTAESPPRT